MSVILQREGVDTISDGCHSIKGLCCYSILTISAVVSETSRLETLYPRFSSSLLSVSSSNSLSECNER